MNHYWRGRISTVDLFVLTNSDQLLYIFLQNNLYYRAFSFIKGSFPHTVLSTPPLPLYLLVSISNRQNLLNYLLPLLHTRTRTHAHTHTRAHTHTHIHISPFLISTPLTYTSPYYLKPQSPISYSSHSLSLPTHLPSLSHHLITLPSNLLLTNYLVILASPSLFLFLLTLIIIYRLICSK